MHKKRDSSFYIGNEKIDIVQNYTCLGTCTSSSGNLTLSLDYLRQKTLYSLFETTHWFRKCETFTCMHAVVKSRVPLFSRFSNPGTTLLSKKLTYNSFKNSLMIHEFNNLSRPLKSVTCSCFKYLGAASDSSPRGERGWLCFPSLIFFI